MQRLGVVFAITLLFGSLNSRSQADIVLTFDLNIDSQVILGNSIDWSLSVTVSDSDATNFGIDSVTADLLDTGGASLTAGTIGTPFSDYSFSSGGTPSGSSLIEIGATLFVQDGATVEAADPANGGTNLGPLTLATGSFTPTALGTFDLIVSAGSANTYFIGPGDFTGSGLPFTTAFNSGSYMVVVPEPTSLLLFGIACIGLGLRRRRR